MVSQVDVVMVLTTFGLRGTDGVAASSLQMLLDQGVSCEVWAIVGGSPSPRLHKLRVPQRSLGLDKHIYRLGTARTLAEELRQVRPRIVHSHSFRTHVHAGRAAHAAGVPYHFVQFHDLRLRLHRALVCRLMRPYVNQVIVLNRYMADFYRRWCGYRESLVCTLNNCVEADRFQPAEPDSELRAELGIPESAFVIGSVGRLARVKGYGYLLRAFAELAGKRDDVWLLLVGEGRKRVNLEQIAADLDIADRTVFAGHQDDIPAYLALFDVFAMASLMEADPVALKEAMACALPVVATNVGGPSVILEEGRTGLLVPRKNPQALADRIAWVADNPAEAAAMGWRAREECVRSYSPDNFARRLWEIYEPWL